MADYVYSVAIQVNSFQKNMADKTVWRINEYSLYNIKQHKIMSTSMNVYNTVTQTLH